MMKKLFAIAITVCSALGVSAQANFSGKWKLQEKQHVDGPEYSNALPDEIVVEQTKDSVITETLSSGQDGQQTKGRSAVAVNDKPSSSTSATSGRKVVRSAAWSADKKTLTITTNIYKQGDENEVELTRVDNWSLSGDGKQLTIDRKSIETVSENWQTKGIFYKQ